MRLVNASHSTSVPATPSTPDGRLTGIPENSPSKKTPNIKVTFMGMRTYTNAHMTQEVTNM